MNRTRYRKVCSREGCNFTARITNSPYGMSWVVQLKDNGKKSYYEGGSYMFAWLDAKDSVARLVADHEKGCGA